MTKTTARLDRLLANMGYASRREIQMLARNGRIFLDDVPMTSAENRIAVTPDLCERLVVDGEALDPLPGLVLMVNKPLGMTCSHKEAGPLIYDLLPTRWRRRDPAISTIGRLDKETSGLILLTDDGAFLHRVISPKNHVAKHYLVTLERPLNGTEAELFASGTLMLEGESKPLLPAALEVLSPQLARLAITEGRYHQVRRMFAATGNHVAALHRESLGGLILPTSLSAGEFRLLTAEEVSAIWV